jgi:hypothetical protein
LNNKRSILVHEVLGYNEPIDENKEIRFITLHGSSRQLAYDVSNKTITYVVINNAVYKIRLLNIRETLEVCFPFRNACFQNAYVEDEEVHVSDANVHDFVVFGLVFVSSLIGENQQQHNDNGTYDTIYGLDNFGTSTFRWYHVACFIEK